MATNFIIIITVANIVILSFCVMYMVWIYRRLLTKHNDMLLREHKSDIKKAIEKSAQRFVQGSTEDSILHATGEAVDMIAKNAKNVVATIKRDTLEKLIAEEKGEEKSIASEFDEARARIVAYEKENIEDIRKKASEILTFVAKKSVADFGKILTEDQKKELVMKAVTDAKRSKLFSHS